MNINDPLVGEMAKRLASETGESVTEVVRAALELRIEQLRVDTLERASKTRVASRAEIHAMLAQIHALPPAGPLIVIRRL